MKSMLDLMSPPFPTATPDGTESKFAYGAEECVDVLVVAKGSALGDGSSGSRDTKYDRIGLRIVGNPNGSSSGRSLSLVILSANK